MLAIVGLQLGVPVAVAQIDVSGSSLRFVEEGRQEVQPWQQQSALLALTDPSQSVREDAVKWMSTKKASGVSAELVAAVAAYLHANKRPEVIKDAVKAMGAWLLSRRLSGCWPSWER